MATNRTMQAKNLKLKKIIAMQAKDRIYRIMQDSMDPRNHVQNIILSEHPRNLTFNAKKKMLALGLV